MPAAAAPRGSSAFGCKVVVLVVEDQPILRWLAVETVEDAGFEAAEACDADAAIKILETRTDIRIIFTDVEMPGSMDGVKLAHAVRGRWPPIEIIVVSGWMHLQSGDIPERARFFRKPYKPEEIIEALHEMAA